MDCAIKALVDLGASVFNGGFSTLLASILLFASEYKGYTTMATMFFGFVFFGLLYGLCLLPILLIAASDFQSYLVSFALSPASWGCGGGVMVCLPVCLSVSPSCGYGSSQRVLHLSCSCLQV